MSVVVFTSFKPAVDALANDLKKDFRETLPFACVVALTRSAVLARDLIKKDMQRVFDRPTPFALKAARAQPATKQTMAAAVLLREFRGTPAEYFLGPEIDGTDRRTKRFEKELRTHGILPPGMFAVPGKAAQKDAYGNQSPQQIVQVLSALRSFSETGFLANRSAKADAKWLRQKHPKRRPKFFVAKSNLTGKPLGIYEVVSRGKVAPVMVFTRPPHYSKRFDFNALALGHAESVFPAQLDAALTEFVKK
ncbi:MAG: hypothetical protein POH28_00515 [Acidocella sp.]|nr:hypothetical protein [Acidocella sp.]